MATETVHIRASASALAIILVSIMVKSSPLTESQPAAVLALLISRTKGEL
jgi:hypothetical protein